jgi:arylsulfatase
MLALALTVAIPFATQAQPSEPAQRARQIQEMRASGPKPNILVIFGDDIGQTNISAYSQGLVGYKTPNIDRIAREGMMFTDYYAENNSVAGRSAFITGQSPLRTGLSRVGAPGASVGLQKGDTTIAEALRPLGYATGQFGKSQLGDKDEYLPTRHGFDEFFGNLYDLNVEEAPQRDYWPKDPNDPYLKNLARRGVLHTLANGGIQDTGPLTPKRMETIDDEITAAAQDFITRQVQAGTPFFVWMNTNRMHFYTHVRPGLRGTSGMLGNEYGDGMVEHDGHVGKLLKTLDDLKIADNTIVIYTTDNGPYQAPWPDAATTPFRGEKETNWEGAFRVPAMIRWPGHIKAGEVNNQMISSLDWYPTLLAAAGDTTIKDRLLKGWAWKAGLKYRNHLDGYNQLPMLTGQSPKSERDEFYYFDQDGELVAMRYGDWKVVFCEQRRPGGVQASQDPLVCLRSPKVFNLRMDPYERADSASAQYNDWLVRNAYLTQIGTMKAASFLETFVDYPPSQRPANVSVEQIRKQVNRNIDEYFRERGMQ